MNINLRIAGESGQVVVSFREILSGPLATAGLHVFTGKSYMSRIRGGLNWTDSSELFGLKKRIDLLVALTQEALDFLKDDLRSCKEISGIFILRVSGRNFGVAGEEQSHRVVTNRQSRKRHRDTSRKHQLLLNDSLIPAASR